MRLCLIFILISCGSNSLANQNVVQWYQPVFSFINEQGLVEVVISGKTKSNNVISLSSEGIPFIPFGKTAQQIEIIKLKMSKSKLSTAADADGYFRLVIMLPKGIVHLPMQITDPVTEKFSNVQVHLKIRPGSIAATNLGKLKSSPEFRKKIGIWLGAGANLLLYEQSSSIADLNFQSFHGPAFLLRGWYKFSENFEIIPTIKSSPGKVNASNQIGLRNGDYTWWIYGLELAYNPEKWRKMFFGKYKSRTNLILGVQHHDVPFTVRRAKTTTDLQSNTFTALTSGVQFLADIGSQWGFETFVRYQHPVASGSLFKVSPRLAFDGSIGTHYRVPSQGYRIGFFWYGQYHEYDFTHRDPYSGNIINGRQRLFFSNFELRLGFEFN